MKLPTLLLGLIFLVGCEGPAGPAGPQGIQGPPGPAGLPGSGMTYVTFVGQLDANGDATVALPAAAGDPSTAFPVINCYTTDDPNSNAWGTATFDSFYDPATDSYEVETCGLWWDDVAGTWMVSFFNFPSLWYFAVTVAYGT